MSQKPSYRQPKTKKSQSNKSDSPYGVAFFVRIGVLLFLLLLLAGGFAYDRFVLVPSGKAAVERVMKEFNNPDSDLASIQKAAGRKPTSTETLGEHEVENWHFGRILPNLTGYKVSIVHNNGRPTDAFTGEISDTDRERLESAGKKPAAAESETE